MIKHMFVRLVLSLALLTAPAAAAVVLVNNFPISGNIDAWAIDGGDAVSDSFVLGSAATITGVNFGLWLSGGATGPGATASIDWSIGATPGTSTYGTGVASVSESYISLDGLGIGAGVFDASFSFLGPLLNVGTYYLTLQGYTDANANFAYWDENDGANSLHAWSNTIGNITYSPGLGCGSQGVGTGTCSESFQILGEPTPEPSTWALLGSGILAAFALRRKAIRR